MEAFRANADESGLSPVLTKKSQQRVLIRAVLGNFCSVGLFLVGIYAPIGRFGRRSLKVGPR